MKKLRLAVLLFCMLMGASAAFAQPQTPQGKPSQALRVRSGVDDQVKTLSQALVLNSHQQAKLRTILERQHEQVMGVVRDNALSSEAKLQKLHLFRQQMIDKVRGTLTTDEQKKRFDALVEASDERMQDRSGLTRSNSGSSKARVL